MSAADIAFALGLVGHLGLAAVCGRAHDWQLCRLVSRVTIPATVLVVAALVLLAPPGDGVRSPLVAATLGFLGGSFVLIFSSLFEFRSKIADSEDDEASE